VGAALCPPRAGGGHPRAAAARARGGGRERAQARSWSFGGLRGLAPRRDRASKTQAAQARTPPRRDRTSRGGTARACEARSPSKDPQRDLPMRVRASAQQHARTRHDRSSGAPQSERLRRYRLVVRHMHARTHACARTDTHTSIPTKVLARQSTRRQRRGAPCGHMVVPL